MLCIYSKRFVTRLAVQCLSMCFVIHYILLCYYSYVSNAVYGYSKLAILEHNGSHATGTNRTMRQDGRVLNESIVPTLPLCKTSVFVLIVVFSSPINFEQRSVIRSTWAQIRQTDAKITNNKRRTYPAKDLVKTIFLLGQTTEYTQSLIKTESELYKDIVLGSFTDSYGNLTLKSKSGLEWANRFCKFEYYLKTDDDVFVYSKGLVKLLWSLPREKLYTGRCDFNKPVIREAGHKW